MQFLKKISIPQTMRTLFTTALLCVALMYTAAPSFAQTTPTASTASTAPTPPIPPGASPFQGCNPSLAHSTALITQAQNSSGLSLKPQASNRTITLPASPLEVLPGDMTVLVYAGGKKISYQKIEDNAYSRRPQVGVSVPETYRKVYGITALQPGDETRYNIMDTRKMMGVECAPPNFKTYTLRDGDIAIVQFEDGRYWTLIFPQDDPKAVYNFEFKNFSELEVKAILGTWAPSAPPQ